MIVITLYRLLYYMNYDNDNDNDYLFDIDNDS